MHKFALFLIINTLVFGQFDYLNNINNKSISAPKETLSSIKSVISDPVQALQQITYKTTTNYSVTLFSGSKLKERITNGGLSNFFIFGKDDHQKIINFYYGQRYIDRLSEGLTLPATGEEVTLIEETHISFSLTAQLNKNLKNAYKYRIGVHSISSNLDYSSQSIYGGIWQEKHFNDGSIRGIGANIFAIQHDGLGENYSTPKNSSVDVIQVIPFIHYRNTYHYHKIGLNYIQVSANGKNSTGGELKLAKESLTSISYDYLFDDGIEFGYLVKLQLGKFGFGADEQDTIAIETSEDIYNLKLGVGVRYNLSNTGYWAFRIDYLSGTNHNDLDKNDKFNGVNLSFNLHSRF